ncbi:helix-turn-helix domain-containing protein [Thermodesulfobacteriota bacterium]
MANYKDIMKIEEVAEYLQIGKRSVYKLAKAGKIPCKKVANMYRFDRESVLKWVQGK